MDHGSIGRYVKYTTVRVHTNSDDYGTGSAAALITLRMYTSDINPR